jgi:preprotein translocase subunit SecB
MVEGTSLFEFNQTDEITNEDKASLLNYSGLSITINYIRGFIATLTSFAPFGRYNLPAIDVNDLLSQKRDMKKEK